ncbi:hypothetical protein KA012_03215 [Candidatus Woesebacteria bacterium]|nr:hypothetical protein [Candidatus Woesebacteria bacterium]
MRDSLPNIFTRQTTGNTKFDLVLRNRELQQLEELLKQIYTYSSGERKAWVQENGNFLSIAFEQFISDASQTLQNMSMDGETLSLSRDLVMSLRETGELLDGLVAKGQRLRS